MLGFVFDYTVLARVPPFERKRQYEFEHPQNRLNPLWGLVNDVRTWCQDDNNSKDRALI
jgi:hypothetical protein